MKRLVKKSVCIGLSILLAIGGISFPGRAQEQGVAEDPAEAATQESMEQASEEEPYDGMAGSLSDGTDNTEKTSPENKDSTEAADTDGDSSEESMDADVLPSEETLVTAGTGEKEDSTEESEDQSTTSLPTQQEPGGNTPPEEAAPPSAVSGEPAVSITYDDNSPSNGKYFPHDRTMTIQVTAQGFDESLLELQISVNGQGGNRTLDDLRHGNVPGTVLVQEPEEDNGTTSFSILFGGQEKEVEDTYDVRVSYDGVTADTQGYEAADEFVVDEVSPVLSVAFMDEKGAAITPARDKDTLCCLESSVTAVLTVTEKYFSPEGALVTVTASDASGKENGAYRESFISAVRTEAWDRDGEAWTYTMAPFEKDANYMFSMEYEDLAGNRTEGAGPCFFTVDTELPTGAVLVRTADGEVKEYSKVLEEKERKELEEGVSEYAFGMYARIVTLENRAEDSASGVEDVQYCLVDASKEAKDTFMQKVSVEKLEWKDFREGIRIDTDRIFMVYEKITDKAGHVTYLSSDGGIIVDNEKPEVPVVTIKGREKNVYDRDIRLEVSAKDPDGSGEGLFSGMKELRYEVVNDETGEVTFQGKTEAERPRTRIIEDEVTIPAEGNESNSVTLRVTAEDHAGNTSVKEMSFSFDTTAPVIRIGFDDSGVRNGHYFSSGRLITVTFRERNYVPGQSKLMVRTGNGDVSLSMAELAEGKGADYGIGMKGMEDSQKDLPLRERTDEREITYRILFGGSAGTDLDFRKLRFISTDEAGNRAEKAEEKYTEFTVDMVPPVVSVMYTAGNNDVTGRIGTNREAPYFTQIAVTPKVTVEERNFTGSGVKAAVLQKDAGGRDVEAYSMEKSSALNKKDWKKEGDRYSFSMDSFYADANYSLGIEAADLAGNRAVYVPHYFTVDKTPPTGGIIVTSGDGSGTFTGYSGSVRFQFMDSSPVAVANRAEDETAGVASVSYYRYVPGPFARGVFSGLSLERLRKAEWSEWSRDLSIAPDSQAVVYARISDRAGNITYISTEGAVIADHTSPAAPEIVIKAGTPAGGIYNHSVPVSVSVEDILSGGTFSGLKNVTIEVLSGGSVTQRYERAFGPKEDRRKSYTEDFTVDAGKNNSNNVTVRVTAADYAGNVSGMEKEMKIDITPPRIEVRYDGGEPLNGRYYNRTRTATVTVRERNFDPSGVNLSISGPARISGWERVGTGTSDDSAFRCTVIFEEDGDYAFTAGVTDLAGNHTDLGKTERFIIDKTAPVIMVSYDNNSGNGRYYNAPRNASITVLDNSFDEGLFEAAVSASLDGKDKDAPEVSGWSHSGSYHRAAIRFGTDGDYSFTLEASDLAGNRAEVYRQGLFTVDMTRPDIRFFGVENGSANRGEAAPEVEYSDLNMGEGRVKLVLSGYRHPAMEVTGEINTLEHGGRVTLPDIAHVITEDDVYTLTASARDLAGNEAEEKLEFSVNRFGSNYYFSDMTAEYLEEYYHKQSSSVEIFEVNVDGLHDNRITLYHDGRVLTLPEGSFKIEDISREDDWKRYRYVLDDGLFTEEGTYEILVGSTDDAGNRQDNKLKGVPAVFAIDRTPPAAVITGIEDGKLYEEESRAIMIAVSDNMAMGTLIILINGEEKASFDAEEIAEAEGRLPFMLTESGSWQEVSLSFEDAAGNRGTADSCRVLLTTNLAARIMHRKHIWLPLLMMAVALVVTIAVRKRKEGKKDER